MPGDEALPGFMTITAIHKLFLLLINDRHWTD